MTRPMSSWLTSSTTTSAPAASSGSRRPARSMPTTSPKPPRRPASTPVTDSSMTIARAGGISSRRTASSGSAGAGFPATSRSRAVCPSMTWSKASASPAAASSAPAFLAEVASTTGIRPAFSRPSRSAVPGKARTGLVLSSLSNSSFWRAARPKAVHSPGPSDGEPVRDGPAAGAQEGADRVLPGPARHQVQVFLGAERVPAGPGGQPRVLEDVVEELLPRRRAELRRVRDHAVEVKNHGIDGRQGGGKGGRLRHATVVSGLWPPRQGRSAAVSGPEALRGAHQPSSASRVVKP